MTVGRSSHGQSRRAWLLLLALISTGCALVSDRPTQPAEPPLAAEPLPGTFRLTSDRRRAPYRLIIRIDEAGGPSGRTAEFASGDEVLVHWSTLPLPDEKWIEVNGRDCEGTFGIQARIETDLLLVLSDGGCRIEILGIHPEGEIHPLPRD